MNNQRKILIGILLTCIFAFSLSACSNNKDSIAEDETLALAIGSEGNYEYEAFNNCTNLSSVISNNLLEISENAFYGCEKLKEIELSKVTAIGNYAFSNCKKLSTVNLSSTISIGDSAFEQCSLNCDITFEKMQIKDIGARAFSLGNFKDGNTITFVQEQDLSWITNDNMNELFNNYPFNRNVSITGIDKSSEYLFTGSGRIHTLSFFLLTSFFNKASQDRNKIIFYITFSLCHNKTHTILLGIIREFH